MLDVMIWAKDGHLLCEHCSSHIPWVFHKGGDLLLRRAGHAGKHPLTAGSGEIYREVASEMDLERSVGFRPAEAGESIASRGDL